MVFYFTSNQSEPPMKIFMGIDKYESKCFEKKPAI
jgi:hypothetical protein